MSLPGDHAPAPAAPAPAAPKNDRRGSTRYTVGVQIEIRPEGSALPMRLATADLSRGGCYVQVMFTVPVGTRLQATLWLDDTPVIVDGLVITNHPQFGNGIRFIDFEGEGESVLKHYLDALAAAERSSSATQGGS